MKYKTKLIESASWLLISMPMLLLTGPFLPDLSAVLISLIFLIIVFSERLWKYFNNWFSYIFFTFCAYIVLRSLTSQNILLSLESSLFYFRFGTFALAVWFLIDNKKNLIKNFTLILIFVYVIALIDGYYQFIYNYNIFGYGSTDTRLSLMLSQKLYLGGYLSRLYPLLFALMIYNSFFTKKLIFIPFSLLIFTDLLIFLSGERTALGLLLITTILIITIIKKLKIFRIITLTISILAIFLISLNNDEIKHRNFDKTINQMGLNEGLNLENIIIFSEHHESIYLSGIEMFKKNPIFGVGPKLFRELCQDEQYIVHKKNCSTHPHNIYIQILSEIGLIGFIFIIIPIFYILRKTTLLLLGYLNNRNEDINNYQASLMICFILSLFPFLPTQNIFNNWINIIYFLPIGFYLHSIYSCSNDSR